MILDSIKWLAWIICWSCAICKEKLREEVADDEKYH